MLPLVVCNEGILKPQHPGIGLAMSSGLPRLMNTRPYLKNLTSMTQFLSVDIVDVQGTCGVNEDVEPSVVFSGHAGLASCLSSQSPRRGDLLRLLVAVDCCDRFCG